MRVTAAAAVVEAGSSTSLPQRARVTGNRAPEISLSRARVCTPTDAIPVISPIPVSGYVPTVPAGTVGDWENCMAQSYVPVRNSDPLMQSETSENSLVRNHRSTSTIRILPVY